MDIGTAKPSIQEQSLLPHHLLDIRDPRQVFSVGDFVREANEIITDIHRRDKIPVVVGGTGFYLRGLMYGLSNAPPSNPRVRKELEEELGSRGALALAKELSTIDPESSAAISPGDTYRLVRALEIYRVSGKPRSTFRVTTTQREDWDLSLVVLDRPRAEVYNRIDERVGQMFAQGLVDEVKALLSMGFQFSDPGMRTIGYREFAEPGAFDQLEKTALTIARNTRHYAKRQSTYFKQFGSGRWLHPEDIKGLLVALELT